MKFFYAEVKKGNNWTSVGETMIEPIAVESQESIGREPEWCCSVFKEAVGAGWRGPFLFRNGRDAKPPTVALQHSGDRIEVPILFCLFCGVRIEIVKHLDLAVETFEVVRPAYTANKYVVV